MEEWVRDFIVDRLSGRRHLGDIVPDLNGLRAEPRKVLAGGPLCIGPVNLKRLAAVFLFFLLLFYIFYWFGLLDTWLFVLASAVFLVGEIMLLWKWLGPRRHELFLYEDGVKLKYGTVSVWCPWGLFNVPGNGFLYNARTLLPTLYLPVEPAAILSVEQRWGDETVARGTAVRAPQFSFTKDNQAIITSYYEVFPEELLPFLLEMGRRLGSTPATVPARDAVAEPGAQDAVKEAENGWISLPVARLAFPPVCCGCESPTTDLLGCMMGQCLKIHFHMPFCQACGEVLRQRVRRGRLIGIAAGAVLCVPALILLLPLVDALGKVFLLALGVPALLYFGWTAGQHIAHARGMPLQVRYWFGTRVKVRFSRPEYARHVLNYLGEPRP